MKKFNTLEFIANNAGLSMVEAIEKAYELGKAEIQSSEDCISREELLKLLDSKTVDTNPDHFNFKDKKDYERWVLYNGYNTGLVQARIYVGELPSVTPSYNSVKTELKPCEVCI
jgi:hypothetical protein